MSAATGSLKQQAVLAAKQGDWERAVVVNEAILEIEPQDVGALNRLGISLIQLKQASKARKAFKSALALDKYNVIAKKNLDKLRQADGGTQMLTFSRQHFIEEPGKTKVTELHRLAGKQVLESVSVGALCELRCKKRYISVEVGPTYVGALPENISFRLSKLIHNGNQYECYIRSVTNNTCSVYIREVLRSDKNKDVTSFPINRAHIAIDDLDDNLIKETIGANYASYDSDDSSDNLSEDSIETS